MKVIDKIEKQFSMTLTSRQLFEEVSTIALLADYIGKQSVGSNVDALKNEARIEKDSSESVGPAQIIKEQIIQLFARETAIPAEEIDDELHFMEMGADSIILAKVIQKIERQFTIVITNRQLFEEFYTIALLANYIQTHNRGAKTDAVVSETVVNNSVVDRTETSEPINKQIIDLFARETAIPAADIDENVHFMEMGADSVVLTKVIQKIEKRFSITLSSRQLFEEYSTIALLAEYLDGQYTGPEVDGGESEDKNMEWAKAV